MRLKLKANYYESWMAAFDSDGLEFRLMNNEGPNRLQSFNLFKKIGVVAPLFGKYDDFLRFKYDNERKVVIYDNIESHFGENKRLLKFSDLNVEDKLKYMSEYVEMDKKLWTDYQSKSTRILCVGDSTFQYDYFSFNDWRSNNGRIFVSEPIRLDIPKWRREIPYAFFAIDFVGEPEELKAIDFNCAPGIYGVKLGLSSTQIVLSIKEWLKRYILNNE